MKLITTFLCASIISVSAFASSSSNDEDSYDVTNSRVCLITVGDDVVNGNLFAGLHSRLVLDKIETYIYFGKMYTTVKHDDKYSAKNGQILLSSCFVHIAMLFRDDYHVRT